MIKNTNIPKEIQNKNINDNNKKAIKDLTYLIDNCTNDIDIVKYLNSRASSFRSKSEYKRAIEDYNKSISLNPVNDATYYLRGECYDKLGNNELAIRDYSKAIELNKKQPLYYFSRGSSLSKNRQYEDAINDLLISETELKISNFSISLCYIELKIYDKAQEFIDKAIKYNTNDAILYIYQALISTKLNDKDKFNYSIERFLASWTQSSSELKKKLVDAVKFDHKYTEYNLDSVFEESPEQVLFVLVSELNYHYTLLLVEILFKLDKNNIINDKYFKLVSFLDSFDENIKAYPEEFSDLYFDIFKERISFEKNSYNLDIKYRFKYNLINHIIDSVFEPKNINNLLKSELMRYVEMLNLFRQLLININGQMIEEIKKKEQQKAKEIADARVKERNEVIAKLSHSVKNLLRSAVIDPLSHMEKTHLYNGKNLSDALKGANLIREIVNGINLSFRGTTDDFYYDAENNSYEPYSLYSMLIDSFKHSVSNMLDGKYFNVFMKQYFPTREKYQEAVQEWESENQHDEEENVLEYINKHLGLLTFNYSLDKDLSIGNQKGSAIKLLILFQEMIFNAIKYSSFVNYDERLISININKTEKNEINFQVSNKYNPEIQAKSSGLGSIIIENFCDLLSGRLEKSIADDIYKVTLIIPDFWKEKE
ncbi:MAG: tetratricopeptide repeat protein [Candidatus Cloacimonadales bacterium]